MFWLYTLKNAPDRYYLSMFLAVDRLYWQLQGDEILEVSAPLFIGHAFRKSREGRLGVEADFFMSNDLLPLRRRSSNSVKNLEELSVSLLSLLGGRVLLWEEIISCLQMHWGKNISQKKIRAGIQWLYLHKKVAICPAVTSFGAAAVWKCSRCGARREDLIISSCARCNEQCVSCNNCISLGRCRSCAPLFLFLDTEKRRKVKVSLQLPPLTVGQQKVADYCVQWLKKKEKELLVWAVTGSGKTESLLPAVKKVLEEGGSVLWVTPRRDVVQELSPRFKEAFPGLEIVTLYRGSGPLWSKGPLVVATAHQAWRFYRRFQLVVVDEVDAYPLLGDETLYKGLDRAGRIPGKRILLTATPLDRWLKKVRKGELPVVLLPARYHGYPLPVPQVSICRKLWTQLKRCGEVPSLESFIYQVIEKKGQGLLFVPRIGDVDVILTWIRKRLPELYDQSTGVSSRDPQRGEKILSFRRGEIRLLVTTTILERGVTVPTCHVVVIGAEHMVFDKASLIQIAGRVGRSASYQQGKVLFIATEATEGQQKAVHTIQRINRQAEKEGLLNKGI